MERKIIILGASGGCLDIVNLIHDINKRNKKIKYKIFGFLDDRIAKAVHGIRIIGKFADAKNYENI